MPRISHYFLFIRARSYFMFQIGLLHRLKIFIGLILSFSARGFSVSCLSGFKCRPEASLFPCRTPPPVPPTLHAPSGISVDVESTVCLRERPVLAHEMGSRLQRGPPLKLHFEIKHSQFAFCPYLPSPRLSPSENLGNCSFPKSIRLCFCD